MPTFTPRTMGGSTAVAATDSSVGGTVTCAGCNAMHISNPSATLNVGVRWGVGAQTAVLTTDLNLPPMGHIVVDINPTITHVAAIGSASGPTSVVFTPGRSA
jgi:hypothetical protein